MPLITIDKQDLLDLLGKEIPDDELAYNISMMGTDLRSITDTIDVEIFPDRPDMLSTEGFAMALEGYVSIKTGLPDLRERTLETLRLGFYLRVLTPGIVATGDDWMLEDRPQPRLSLRIVNACAHHELDRELAQLLVEAAELSVSWRQIFAAKLERSGAD